MIDNGVKDQGLIEAIRVSSEETKISSNTIDLLKARLPSLPLNEGDFNAC